MVDIKISEDQLSAYLHEAVMKALGEDAKALIVSQAVTYLTKPDDSGYGRAKTSPLMAAMHAAAYKAAEKVVTEQIENDTAFRAQLDTLYKEALDKVFAKKDDIVERMATSLRKVLTGSEY